MAAIDTDKQHFKLFTEMGFVACNQMDEGNAMALFKAAELCGPNSALPKMGFAYIHLLKLEIKLAIHHLESLIKDIKDGKKNDEGSLHMAEALLGLCKTFTIEPAQLKEGLAMLEKLSKSTDKHGKDSNIIQIDESTKEMAKTALDFATKQFVKAAGPAGNP